jgi:hypothetical protein
MPGVAEMYKEPGILEAIGASYDTIFARQVQQLIHISR